MAVTLANSSSGLIPALTTSSEALPWVEFDGVLCRYHGHACESTHCISGSAPVSTKAIVYVSSLVILPVLYLVF